MFRTIRSLPLHLLLLLSIAADASAAFTLSMRSEDSSALSRRRFFSGAASAVGAAVATSTIITPPANAVPQIFNTPAGIKYAVTKQAPANAAAPQTGDIVAVEYTGYLTNGEIFDATHAEGKRKELLFKLGDAAVIPGLNDMVSNMVVGQKVQAIIPPSLAYGDKGVCLESGECLIKPGSTLVYDVYLLKSSIPPP